MEWRSGRNFASKRARSFGYHKSYGCWFEQGFGSIKRDHQKVVFFDTHLSLVLTIAVHKTVGSAVNCKDAELLAVRDERRRLWRSGRSSIAAANTTRDPQELWLLFEQGFWSKRRKDHPEDGPFFHYKNTHDRNCRG